MESQRETIEIDPSAAAILRTLQAKAEAQGVSLASLLLPIVEGANGTTAHEPTPYELVEDIFDSITFDSSVPDPAPSAQPRSTALGQLVAEKLRKQGLQIP